MSKTLVFTDDNFENEVLRADIPVLVDFWAEWCGPCRILAPVIEEIAGEYGEKIRVGKLNVDENPKVTSDNAIRSIPSLVLFKNGRPVDKTIGAVPKSQIVKVIENNLNGNN